MFFDYYYYYYYYHHYIIIGGSGGGVCVHVPWSTCGNQRTTCRSQFSLSTGDSTQIVQFYMASAFVHGTILPVHVSLAIETGPQAAWLAFNLL